MYNPQRFKSTDREEAFEFMDKNPFATIITAGEGEPFVSHLPLTPKKVGNQIELIGHLARANPHWKFFTKAPSLVIFLGAHTYITPTWYTENDVPTWNYSAIHVKGSVELVENYEGIVDGLKELASHVERYWPSGWKFFIPEDLAEEILPKSIVGFKILVEDINFKKKLSQNRSPKDLAGILKGLEIREDAGSKAVLADMRKLYSKK